MPRRETNRLGGPSAYAIPSLNEIDGRLLVTRVVAAVSLERLLGQYDARRRALYLAALRRAIERKARHAKFTDAEAAATSKYADCLLEETIARTSRNSSTGDNR